MSEWVTGQFPPLADLTTEQLRELVDYNPKTGKFYGATGPAFGKELGRPHSRGYVAVYLRGKTYLAHRLAWLYVNGKWPDHTIDHINGDRADNRIENLRDITMRENIRAGGERYMEAWRQARLSGEVAP